MPKIFIKNKTIPAVNGIPLSSDINNADDSNISETKITRNTPIKTVYGERFVGLDLSLLVAKDNKILCLYVLCGGEIDEFLDVKIGENSYDINYKNGVLINPISSDVQINAYTGESAPPVDPLISSVIAGYSDTHANIATIVVLMPHDLTFEIQVKIRGYKINDFGFAYTKNAGACLADFIKNKRGKSVNSASVTALINYCTANNLEINESIKKRLTFKKWIEKLRGYANCIVVFHDEEYYFYPHKITLNTFVFSMSNILKNSFKLTRKQANRTPNIIKIIYSDTTTYPYTEQEVIKPDDHHLITEKREETYRFLGITNREQAEFLAHQYLQRKIFGRDIIKLTSFDESIKIIPSDVGTVDHEIWGGGAKQFRCLDTKIVGLGRWELTLESYDDLMYSLETNNPILTDENLPDNPYFSKIPVNFQVVGEVYINDNGDHSWRLRCTWDDADTPYTNAYMIEFKLENESDTEYQTHKITLERNENGLNQTLIENLIYEDYEVRIRHINTIGITSNWVEVIAPITTSTVTLTDPVDPKIYFKVVDGKILNVKVRAGYPLDSNTTPPQFLAVFISLTPKANKLIIDNVVSNKAYIKSVEVLDSGSLTVRSDVPNTLQSVNIFDGTVGSNYNFAGQWWGEVVGKGDILKARDNDNYSVMFSESFNATPVAGDTFNYYQIPFYDNRTDEFKMGAVYDDLGELEVIRWSSIKQDGTGLYIDILERGAENTTQIPTLDDREFWYYPALGQGTDSINFDLRDFKVETNDNVNFFGVIDKDVDIAVVDNYHYISATCVLWIEVNNKIQNDKDVKLLRSNIVPMRFGGESY